MRKLLSLAGAAIIGAAVMVTPADAQGQGAFGSCGYTSDAFGVMSLFPQPAGGEYNTVPNLFWQVNYYGVAAPTAIGAIIRFNNELETQTALGATVVSGSNGSFAGVIRGAQDGGGFTRGRGKVQGLATNKGRSERGSAGVSGADTSRAGFYGGIYPAKYQFHIYTGEIIDKPETVKDGPSGRRFIADEKNYLGSFWCAVEDDK